MSELTPRQKAFCLEYIVDLNATQAAIRVGYSAKTAEQQASRLLSKVKVKENVQVLMNARAKRVQVDADDILRELKRIGYSDLRGLYKEDGTIKHPTEWPEELALCIASIEVTETFERDGKELKWTGYTKKVKFWDKPRALELLGKHKKLFTEKVELNGAITLESLVLGSMPMDGEE